MERHSERLEHDELMFGIVASYIANFAGKQLKDDSLVTPADFMPRLRAKKRKAEREIPPELKAQNIRSFLMAQAAAQEKRTAR